MTDDQLMVDDDVDRTTEPGDGADVATPAGDTGSVTAGRAAPEWKRVVAFGVLPAVAVLLGGGAGFLKWQWASRSDARAAAEESVAAARDTTTAILSYRAESVQRDLTGARDRLTGSFLDAYTQLINEVVIPGAKEKKITAVAQVPAAASVSASSSHAVALVFVNQSTTVGNDAPTNTSSSVRVTLDRVGDRWLVSGFDPV